MTDFKKLPEFKALQAVLAAMVPLRPEGRRKVVEAVHALLTISPGTKPSHDFQGPGEPGTRTAKKKRRR